MTALATRRWYDVFANFYDASLDGTYREHRKQAVKALQLSPGMTVVDVGCGTGASFPYLVEAVGPTGRVVGADASPGMLAKAKARAARNGWSNVSVLEMNGSRARPATVRDLDGHSRSQSASASTPADGASHDAEKLKSELGRIDRVQFFLSLSVIPGWQDVLSLWLAALPADGRVVIADVHNEKPGMYARFVEMIARADITRKTWEPLASRPRYELTWQPSSWVLGGRFFTAGADRG